MWIAVLLLAGEALRRLGQQAEARGSTLWCRRSGADGAACFLVGVGVRKGEVTKAAARVVRAACEAAQWASLTRARETAAQLEGLGLHLPELLGGANAETAACAACGVER